MKEILKNKITGFLNLPDSDVWVDLHTHTTASDGIYSSNELVKTVAKLLPEGKKAVIAFTDHDNVDGLVNLDWEAVPENIAIIPGVEFSFSYKGVSKDMLGYGIDVERAKAYLDEINEYQRVLRIQNGLLEAFKHKAKRMGIEFDFDLVCSRGKKCEAYGLLIEEATRHPQNIEKYPCLAQDFYRGHFSNPNSEWYVDESKDLPSLREVIDLIHTLGGKAFVAHPFDYRSSDSEKRQMIIDAAACGVDGVEAKHYSVDFTRQAEIAELAKTLGIYQSGGTDFHGQPIKKDVDLFTGRFNNMRVNFVDLKDWIKQL